MDLHDHELDSLIHLSLQPTPVTSQQKQAAWERLQAALAEPVTAAEETPALRARLARTARDAWLVVRSFALEEARYESARQERYTFRYYSFTPDPASFSLEILGPMRMSKLGQMC